MRFIIFLVSFIGIVFFSVSFNESYAGILTNIFSLLFVFGGTFLAISISFPFEKIRQLKSIIRHAYESEKFDFAESTKKTITIAREYKRLGLKTLEDASEEMRDPYLRLGLQLIADNAEWEEIKASIKKEFIFNNHQNQSAQRIIRSMAKYAPAFGLAGTVLGLMRIFPQLSNPVHIGSAMSLALLTTLYGVLAANLIFLPFAHKLKENLADQEVIYGFILEALQCIKERDYSIVIEQRLSAHMPKHELLRYKTAKSETVQHLRMVENS